MTTVAVIPQMTHDEAETITEQITFRLDAIADNYEVVMPLIREAIERGAHDVLGYPSVGAYVSDQFGGALSRLGVEVRREVVRELSAAGMSTRAIAPIVGVTRQMVSKDIHANEVATELPPELSDAPGTTQRLTGANSASEANFPALAAVNLDTGEVFDAPTTVTETHTVKTVTGLDGKTYKTQEPKTPQRRALTETARDTGWELHKTIEKLQRITEDDRFTRNKEEVASHLRGHLQFAIESCQGILDAFNTQDKDTE
ncbi:hypothetical protein [Glaciibacter psychrotolerans]|uniref:Uncharacterized protein n=1 Tax=Glaciibacter psychrotolerans TaxID=670054 RepID=A0A7Z0J575_9MICO|nr:hypothetical protein [Leifsonia psychrotolerans]NYJ19147.1 hypothetical protein [Leifsonia psychrotolerans]